MNSMFVCFSSKVTMAPQLPFPTMVSISKSPKRTPSTSFGLSLTLTRLGMTTRLPPTGLARCFNLYRKVGSATTILEDKDNIQDILPDASPKQQGIERSLFPDLSPEEQSIIDVLMRNNDLQINMISVQSGIDISRLTALLFTLEMKGIIRTLAGGMYHLLN